MKMEATPGNLRPALIKLLALGSLARTAWATASRALGTTSFQSRGRSMCRAWFPMYETSTTVFFMTSREMGRFHCQLSGGRNSSLTALKDVVVASAFFRPGLMVSRLRKLGLSLREEL